MSSLEALTLIMPVYNEATGIEKIISEFYDEVVRNTGAEFTIAEDGSTDGTKEILQKISTKLPIELYLGSERKGYARAAKDALKRANSPYVFFSDSDGQYIPSDFWSLWDHRFEADMVIGRKIQRAEGIHRIILSKGFHMLTRMLFGVKLHDIDCGFRLVKRTLLIAILDKVEELEYSFWGEFTIRALASKARIVEVPIHQSRRVEGETRIYLPKKLPKIVVKQLLGLFRLKRELDTSR